MPYSTSIEPEGNMETNEQAVNHRVRWLVRVSSILLVVATPVFVVRPAVEA